MGGNCMACHNDTTDKGMFTTQVRQQNEPFSTGSTLDSAEHTEFRDSLRWKELPFQMKIRVIEQLGTNNENRDKHCRTNWMFDQVKCQEIIVGDERFIYEGQWLESLPHGFGKAYYQNGDYFEGHFVQGWPECQDGLIVKKDGGYFRGSVKGCRPNGKGRASFRNIIYFGQWRDGKPHGQGTQTIDDTIFEGDFMMGAKEGFGRLQLPNGVFEGSVVDNQADGSGIFIFKDGSVYRGNFKNNHFQGNGSLITDQGCYLGDFHNGKKQGHGQQSYKNGNIYSGFWLDDFPHGMGKLTLPNGQQVIGKWRNGKNVEITSIKTKKQEKIPSIRIFSSDGGSQRFQFEQDQAVQQS